MIYTQRLGFRFSFMRFLLKYKQASNKKILVWGRFGKWVGASIADTSFPEVVTTANRRFWTGRASGWRGWLARVWSCPPTRFFWTGLVDESEWVASDLPWGGFWSARPRRRRWWGWWCCRWTWVCGTSAPDTPLPGSPHSALCSLCINTNTQHPHQFLFRVSI